MQTRDPVLTVLDELDIPKRPAARDGRVIIVVPGLAPEDAARLREAGHDPIATADLVTPAIDAEAKRAAVDILDRMRALPVDGGTLDAALSWRGLSLVDVGWTHLVSALVESLTAVAALDEWLATHPVREIRVPRERVTWSAAACAVAEARGIPVAVLRDIPRREPMRPFSRRSVTQWLPPAFRRYREARDADRETRALGTRPPGEAPVEPVDFLVVAHYIAEARALSPIIRALSDRGAHRIAVVVDEWGRANEAFTAAGFPFTVLQDLGIRREDAARVLAAERSLGRVWRRSLRGARAWGITHRGVRIVDVVGGAWDAFGAVSTRHDCIRQYLWWITLCARAFDIYRPRVLLLADEAMPVNVIQLGLAEKRGIATFHVQHGALPDHPKHRAARATCVTVGGDAIRRFLVSRGSDPARIRVTGIPQFDPLADREALEAISIRETLGIPADRSIVVYTMLSGQGVTAREEVIAATTEVLSAAEALRDRVTFVFKRHPADKADILSQMGVDPAARGIIVTLEAPIHPLLYAADVVVTQMSTTGQEALMLDKPLVVLNLSGRGDSIPYVEYGAAIGVYRPGSLADAIAGVIGTSRDDLAVGRERFVADFVHRVDGRATERIVGLAASLASNP